MSIDLQPVGGTGRIIVKRDEDAARTAAGVVIPIVCRRHEQTGVVLAVHAGVVRPCDVKPGDRVLFGKYSGSDLVWGGQTITIMAEDEIMAVLDG